MANRKHDNKGDVLTKATTEEPPRERWPEFLADFEKGHQGRVLTVTVLRRDIGAQEQAAHLPLQGISATIKGPGKDEVTVILGRLTEQPWTRIISGASAVRLEKSADGLQEALEVESRDGFTTILQFEVATSPEKSGGFLPPGR